MNDKKTGLLSHAMTYGAIIGLALIVYSVLLYIMDQFFNRSLGLLQYAILIAGIFIACKTFRDKQQDGFITYGRALGLGTLISVFVGILISFFYFVMLRFIDPELIEKYMLIAEEQMQNNRFIPEDQIEPSLERTRKMMSGVVTIPIQVATFTFFGFIISLITSAFVKKNPNPVA